MTPPTPATDARSHSGWLRGGLMGLSVLQFVVGVWTVFFPESFYNDVPTVDWTPPYSEHLFRDFGSTLLGLGILLIAAAIWLERRLVTVALVAFLAYSITHLAFHADHLKADSPTWSAILLAFTSLEVLVPLALLPAALRRPLAAG